MKLQEIELTIKDENEDGVFAISLVDSPAIEENFLMLSSQAVELKILDEEKRTVVGFALVPEKRIYRKVKDKEFNKIYNDEVWKEIKLGTYKGYSIEGMYDGFDKLEASQEECETVTAIKEFLKNI